MVLCHYEGILRSKEEDPVYVRGERKVVLIDKGVTFDQFESQIKRVNGCRFSTKIIYSFKCEAMSFCVHVPVQED